MATRTCKLEYMMRNFNSDDKKEIIWLIDKDGYNDFNSYNIREVINFKHEKSATKNEFANRWYELELASYNNTSFRFKYIFTRINEIFIANNVCPIFTDPSNIDECLDIREDMIMPMSYNRANEFFGVSNYREYVPPKYNK
jgi:hypothetical protein